ncbi:MAG: Lpg1974 family pore-forming outer membrane protein [Gemmataceae bacterium]
MRSALLAATSLWLIASAEVVAQTPRPKLGFDDAPTIAPKVGFEESQAPPTTTKSMPPAANYAIRQTAATQLQPPARVPDAADLTELPHLVPQEPAVASPAPVAAAPAPVLAGQLRVGGGAMYLKPSYDTNPAYARVSNVPTPTLTSTTTTQQNFGSSYSWSPYGWLEYGIVDGLGVRGRFWQYADTPATQTVFNNFVPGSLNTTQVISAFPLGLGIISNPGGAGAGFNDDLAFRSSLVLTAYDLELTREFRTSFLWISVSGGGRYAETTQTYDASLLSSPAVAGAGTVRSDLRSSHHFDGFGGTLALEVGVPILESRWSVYGGTRGSLVYGSMREAASLSTTTTVPGGLTTVQLQSASAIQDRLLPIVARCWGTNIALRWGRFQFFTSAALVKLIEPGYGNALQ